MGMEPIVKAVASGDYATRVGLAQMMSISITNTTYAAYAFYQARKGEPLTPDEMKEIKENVLMETNDLTEMLLKHLNNCFDNTLAGMD